MKTHSRANKLKHVSIDEVPTDFTQRQSYQTSKMSSTQNRINNQRSRPK